MMADKFPATNDTVPEVLARIRREAAALKRMSERWLTDMQAAGVDVEALSSMNDSIKRIDNVFASAVTTYGEATLGSVASTYLGKDPIAGFRAMRLAMEAARIIIRDTVPVHEGNPLEFTMDAVTGEKSPVVMASEQTQAAQAALQSLIATID